MKVVSMHVRGYRSIRKTSLTDCGSLNVLIGKNNAGKSNLLAAFDLLLFHLKRGTVAGRWPAERPIDELNGRQADGVAQIGVEFRLPSSFRQALGEKVAGEAPHLEKSVAQF